MCSTAIEKLTSMFDSNIFYINFSLIHECLVLLLQQKEMKYYCFFDKDSR